MSSGATKDMECADVEVMRATQLYLPTAKEGSHREVESADKREMPPPSPRLSLDAQRAVPLFNNLALIIIST